MTATLRLIFKIAPHHDLCHIWKIHLQEIFDMEKNIEMLKKAIEDKANPMQVSKPNLTDLIITLLFT